MYQGKPKYKQRGGQAIIYFSSEWKINDEDRCGAVRSSTS